MLFSLHYKALNSKCMHNEGWYKIPIAIWNNYIKTFTKSKSIIMVQRLSRMIYLRI